MTVRLHRLPILLLGIRLFCEKLPELPNAHPLHRQHAVLQRVQILPMNRGHELAGDETDKDAGREVVLAEAVAELGVLGEGLSEG